MSEAREILLASFARKEITEEELNARLAVIDKARAKDRSGASLSSPMNNSGGEKERRVKFGNMDFSTYIVGFSGALLLTFGFMFMFYQSEGLGDHFGAFGVLFLMGGAYLIYKWVIAIGTPP